MKEKRIIYNNNIGKTIPFIKGYSPTDNLPSHLHTKQCRNCGATNPTKQVFCVKCRRRFIDAFG